MQGHARSPQEAVAAQKMHFNLGHIGHVQIVVRDLRQALSGLCGIYTTAGRS